MRSLALAVFLCAGGLAPALAAAQTYPIQCRGGGMSHIGLQVFPNGQNRLTVGFKHGTKPAAQGLAPGECAWLDRGMRADEPQSLCDDVKDAFLSTTGTNDSSYNPSHILLVQSAWSNDAPYLKAVTSNDLFTVLVHREGEHCLAVEGMAPPPAPLTLQPGVLKPNPPPKPDPRLR
jgi:hypothetical protein